jgi:hypothetical protein
MKNLHISISFFILFSLFLTGSLAAQTDTVTIKQKGNLNLFTERIYLASKAYQTGVHIYNIDYQKIKKDSIVQSQSDTAWSNNGLINRSISTQERPIRVVVIKNGERTMMRDDELNKIPIESIQSIEIIYGAMAPALYGVDGSCGIIVKLIDNKQ